VVKDSYFYPSVGVSFIPTKAFASLKDNKTLTYAKVNASYTSVGNTSSVGTYAINNLATVPAGFPFGNLSALAYNINPTDPNIRPEFVNTFEVGAQLGFFKNDRVTLEGSYYVADTKDLITRTTSSSASGNASLFTNAGDLQNKGYEIDLGLRPIYNDNFKWDLRTSYSTYKTTVTALSAGVNQVNLQSNNQIGIFAEVWWAIPFN